MKEEEYCITVMLSDLFVLPLYLFKWYLHLWYLIFSAIVKDALMLIYWTFGPLTNFVVDCPRCCCPLFSLSFVQTEIEGISLLFFFFVFFFSSFFLNGTVSKTH